MVYVKRGSDWNFFIYNKNEQSFATAFINEDIKNERKTIVTEIAVRPVERLGNIGETELISINFD